jgi:hypothetical protein
LNKLTEEYEKKFKSAITDFEIRLKEQKLSILYELERLNDNERGIRDEISDLTPCRLDCNTPNCPCSNPTQRCGDRDECLKLDDPVRSTTFTLSTLSDCPCFNPTQRYDRDEGLKQDGTVRSTSTLSTSLDDCNTPNCPCSNPTQGCGDRDEGLKLDLHPVISTSTDSTLFREEYYINQHHDLVGLWDKI